MALSAAGLAAAITSAQGVATGSPASATIQSAANMALATAIVDYLIANTVVSATIPPSAIATAGGPTSQVGPPAPVPLTGTIS